MIELKRTSSTPYVLFDENKSYMMFKGESFPENVTAFYGDILAKLKEHLESSISVFVFDCELVYFNSSSSKLLMNMMGLMDDAAQKGKDITVNWITTADNEIITECGEEFAEDFTNFTFNIIEK